MKVTCDTPRVSIDAYNGETTLTVHVTPESKHNLAELADLRDKPLSLELKRHYKARSLDANAYCWALIHKLAAKLRVSPVEVYRGAMYDVGDNVTVVCAPDKAVDKLIEAWGRNGIGWIANTMPSKLAGCTNVLLYYGSSTFDTRQMSRLIDIIVQDCKDQGIETLTPAELAGLKEAWE